MKLSAEELREQKLSVASLESAVEQVRLNGFVLFENVLEPDLVNRMNDVFMETLELNLSNKPDSTEVNTSEFRKNRVRMDLPFATPFNDPNVIAHPLIIPIVEQLLGEDMTCVYLSADAPLPGSAYQVVHSDVEPFYPDASITLPPSGLVLNIPLVDVTEKNGAMDAWPGGTHLIPENRNNPQYIEEAAKHIDPVRMTMPKGSLLLRDLRMWHRGTPNTSDEVRPNVAIIYAKPWWRTHYQKTLGITRKEFEALPERTQKLFRLEKIRD